MWSRLFKSKTFYTGLAAVGFGIFRLTQGDVDGGITSLTTGLGMIFLRDGIAKAEGKR